MRSVVFLVVLAVALAVGGCADPRITADHLEGYQPGPGEREITIIYGAVQTDYAPRAEVLAEDATMVKIRVTYRHSDDRRLDMLLRLTVVATLREPLGDRKVVDDRGEDLPRL